jgi:hypothetical protein
MSEIQPERPENPSAPWQSTSSTSSHPRAFKKVASWILGLASLGLVALAMIFYSVFLAFAPSKTPMLLLNAAPYENAAIPPVAFLAEDAARFSLFDNLSLNILNQERRVSDKNSFFSQLQIANNRFSGWRRNNPLIIWISMHGVVLPVENSEEKKQDPEKELACFLLPPLGSIDQQDTLIKLSDVFDQIKNLAKNRNVIVLMDCTRLQRSIPLGLYCNNVSDHLTHEISRHINDHIAVILACNSGENSDPKPFNNGSIFAQQTCQALEKGSDKNSDDWIDLNELDSRLSEGVSTWATTYRSTTQTPKLIRTPREVNFKIANAIQSERSRIKYALNVKESKTNQTLTDSQIDLLWSRWDDLRSQHLYSYEPKEWHLTERKIQALERWSRAGKDYESLCTKVYREVEQRIDELRSTLDSNQLSNDDEAILLPFSKKAPLPLKVEHPDYGPWCRYFGVEYNDENNLIDQYLALLSSKESDDRVTVSLQELALEVPSNNRNKSLQFLKMWGRNLLPGKSDPLQSPISLLRAQERLERLAVPTASNSRLSIEYVHSWIRKLLVSSDLVRRKAEDFTISFPWTENSSAQEFEEQLGLIEGSHQLLVEQVKLQHQMAATLPEISDWLTNPTIRVGTAALKRSLVAEKLEPLLASLDDHERKLSQGPDPQWTFEQIRAELNNIEQHRVKFFSNNYERLEKAFLEQARGLLKTPSDLACKSIEEIDYFIENPMTPGKTRERLKILRYSANRLESSDGQVPDPTPTHIEGNGNTVDTVTRGSDAPSVNPILSRLTNDSPKSNKWLTRLGWTIGKYSPGIDSNAVPKTNSDSNRIADARLQRWCYSLGFWDIKEDFLTADLRRNQLDWLLWSAEHSMEDFWGPAGDSKAYFEQLTEHFFQCATQTIPNDNDDPYLRQYSKKIQKMREGSDQLKILAQVWCKLDAEPDNKINADNSLETSLTAYLNEDLNQGRIYPSSTLALIGITKPNSAEIEPNMSDGRSLPLGEDIRLELRLNQLELEPRDSLVGALRFRGHEIRVPIPFQKIGGYVTRTEFERATESNVCVHDTSKKLSVNIILDCSQSMGELIAGKDAKSSRKIDIAKKTLADLLLRLAYRGDNQVGLHVVGNRIGWSRRAPIELLKRPGVKFEPGDELTPSIDIETLSSLTEMNVGRAKTLIARISSVDAWGQSPLYLAIDRALQEFPSQESHENSHVILLTDGTNYQFIDSTENVSPTTIADVLRMHRKTPVPVHVFGIGMDRVKHSREISELESLTQATGGSFETIQDQQDLGDAIQKLLRVGSFEVSSLADDPVEIKDALWVPSSRTTQIQVPEATAEAMQVRYKNPRSGKSASQSTQDQNDLTEPIWLEGGESISLSADIDKRRLLAKPFHENVVATQVMVDAFGEPTKKVVRVHQPQWSEEGELSIPISWQDTWDDPKEPNPDLIDWRFSRRPDSIWITLTPVGGSSELRANRFVFYDRSFQKGLGVPVTHLRVLDWPAESSTVKVDIKSQFTRDSNSERIQDQVESLPAPVGVLNLGQRSKPLMKSFELLSAMQDWLVVAEGVKLKASKIKSDQVKDGDVLEIRLTTDSEAFDVTSLKTNLIGTAQDHIVAVDRRFDQQNKIAIHTFQTNRKIDDSRTNITISNLEWEIPKLQSFTCGPLEIEIPIQRNRLPAANTAIRP